MAGNKFDFSPDSYLEKLYHNNLALNFVRAGYLVIIPELLGFGDRRLKKMIRKILI